MKIPSFGQRIRQLRDERDISLREFAQRLGLSPAFISDIELGRRFPSEEVLKKMALELQTSLEDLKAHDARPPVEEIRGKIEAEPQFATLLRRAIEHKSFDSQRLSALLDELEKDE